MVDWALKTNYLPTYRPSGGVTLSMQNVLSLGFENIVYSYNSCLFKKLYLSTEISKHLNPMPPDTKMARQPFRSWAKGNNSAQHVHIPNKINHIKSRSTHFFSVYTFVYCLVYEACCLQQWFTVLRQQIENRDDCVTGRRKRRKRVAELRLSVDSLVFISSTETRRQRTGNKQLSQLSVPVNHHKQDKITS